MKIKNELGKQYGDLTVIASSDPNRWVSSDGLRCSSHARWLCKCKCGKECIVTGDVLRCRKTKNRCSYCSKEIMREKMKQQFTKEPFVALYNRLKNVASYRKHDEFTLTFDDFKEFTKITSCEYCGHGVVWEKNFRILNGRQVGNSYNLDRKDSSLGYSKENCVVCCRVCNVLKLDIFTYEEMKRIGPFTRNILNERKN